MSKPSTQQRIEVFKEWLKYAKENYKNSRRKPKPEEKDEF